MVNELSGYAQLLGDVGQVVAVEPRALGELGALQVYLAVVVVGSEAHHESAGVGPGLRTEVAQVGDVEARLLHDFTVHGLLECLARLDEACHESVVVVAEAVSVDEEYLFLVCRGGVRCRAGVAATDEDDDCRGQRGPYLLAAVLALLRDCSVEAHGASADAAELGVLVPVEQLVALAGLQVVGFGQLVVRLAQGTHLVAVVVRQGCVDTEGLDAVDIHDGGPGFWLCGDCCGYLVVVGYYLEDEV